MADPEGLLVEGARRAAVAARELWWRRRPLAARDELTLARVKRRLELFVAALCGEAPALLPSDPPPPPTWLARAFGRAPRHLRLRRAAAGTDGTSVWLPRTLPTGGDEDAAAGRYRVLALEQALRAMRGSAACLPPGRLLHDLYVLAEAVAVDHALVRAFPGLAADVRAGRAEALHERPGLAPLTAAEREVEQLVRDALAADPARPPATVPLAATPTDSLTWARATAGRLGPEARRHRGVAVVPLWGQLLAGAPPRWSGDRAELTEPEATRPPLRSAPLRRRPRVRPAADDEDDERPGTWMVRADEPMEGAEDPMGLQRPADRDDDAEAADLADSLSELPEARVVRTPGSPREVLESDAGVTPRGPARGEGAPGAGGIVYPEWDYRLAAYRARGVVVRPGRVAPGSAAWVDDVMARHAALVRRVRRRFDGLRPRRQRLGRQADGAELDLAAYVTAFADWQARQPGDDRFYVDARPARRDLAIALLVDVSASTDSWVAGNLRIIDVEKQSLIVLLEALDALGDRHAALGFSGEGPGDVRVTSIKDFAEPLGADVRRRVAALEPDGYTRAGAAIRHASALLARQAARHRLLLVLSDGKPNDVDQYQGRYGLEDTRQAVVEARLSGLVPFCLTVDRDAPAYMPAVFGRRGYALLRRQELLPGVLVEVVRRLLAA